MDNFWKKNLMDSRLIVWVELFACPKLWSRGRYHVQILGIFFLHFISFKGNGLKAVSCTVKAREAIQGFFWILIGGTDELLTDGHSVKQSYI